MARFDDQLRAYARLIIATGIQIRPGQRLLIQGPVEGAPLVRLMVEEAYRAGARFVDVLWGDDATALARFEHAPRDSFEEIAVWRAEALKATAKGKDAVISVHATDPDLLSEQDPDLVATSRRVMQEYLADYSQMVASNHLNWCVVALPVEGWARKVFPDAGPAATEKLWDAIFAACRVDRPDPIAAWEEHLEVLRARREHLIAKQYTELRYRAPGTDLRVGMPRNHIWLGGQVTTKDGHPFVPNLPTEEVFSLPHRDRTEGTVRATKPLAYSGSIIEDFTLTFEKGSVVNAEARRGQPTLDKLLDTDPGARRLGEVALVPHSSPISASGLLFYNTLFDENASCHLAIGRGYQTCLAGGPDMDKETFAEHGGNVSLIHNDFMIGSEKMDIDGVTAAGAVEPLMRGGEWVDALG
jgi:aminopeptidase